VPAGQLAGVGWGEEIDIMLTQRLLPGIIGISTYVDFAYQREMQRTAVSSAGTPGPINQLRTVTVTLNFSLLLENLAARRLEQAEQQVAEAAEMLQAAGSDFIVVTSGTTSTLTGLARTRLSIPILDIAAACWCFDQPLSPVGLLSTRYAAAGGMFHAAAEKNRATLVVPSDQLAEQVDATIFGELVLGKVSKAGIDVLVGAIGELAAQGARSIILGNTDMTLAAAALSARTDLAIVDAALAHARAAAHAALTGEILSR
jgi:aspartate racemase